MITSRKIEDLNPRVAAMARAFIDKCNAAGIDVIITSTYRDLDAQGRLYAQGRGTPGAIITNAKPGESWHNWHLAFDFVPIEMGKAAWNDSAAFQRCGAIAESVGLQWAGRWTGPLREMGHCQWTGGLTISDLQAGKVPEGIAPKGLA